MGGFALHDGITRPIARRWENRFRPRSRRNEGNPEERNDALVPHARKPVRPDADQEESHEDAAAG